MSLYTFAVVQNCFCVVKQEVCIFMGDMDMSTLIFRSDEDYSLVGLTQDCYAVCHWLFCAICLK